MSELTDAELVALAGTVKDGPLKAAKGRLADGSAHPVDFSVRIVGSVQKGMSTPETTFTRPATVGLRSFGLVCAVLRNLGIGPKRLAAALAAVPSDATADAELEAVFSTEEERRAATLPPITGTTPGRAGTVQSQVTATRL